jgi:hypothetical protein
MKRTPLLRKTPLRKKSGKDNQKWKNKCDILAQKICVSGGTCSAQGYGFDCSTQLQWAHLKSRRFAVIRHDPKNSTCLCAAHHRFFTDHPDLWRDFIEEMFPGRWAYLNERLRENVKVDYQLLHVALSEQLRAIQEAA